MILGYMHYHDTDSVYLLTHVKLIIYIFLGTIKSEVSLTNDH